MSDRRRSLFILLLVAALIAGSGFLVATKRTLLGLDLQGGVQLVYQAQPTAQQPTITPEAIQRSLDIMRKRVDALGVSEPALQQTGNNQIEVALPGVEDADRAAAQVGSTAQLYFYDWEANLLDESCRTNPDTVNGGQNAITGLYQAVTRASKCTNVQSPNADAAAAPRWYAFQKGTNRPLATGQTFNTRAQARAALSDRERTTATYLQIPKNVLVVRAASQSAAGTKPDQWWILRDAPGLSGTDIKSPEQSFEQQGSGDPIVTFQFTDKGRTAFRTITRRIAERGADNALPGTSPLTASQHFAIVLDNDLVSTPFINYNENPEGIDGSTGAQISGGFTIQSAQDLAKILQIGALPVKLELISRSQVSATLGKQALDQGLIAGIAGLIIVAGFLIVFYRLLGVIAAVALVIYALYFYALVKLIPITLSLPGIAGLILTLGVAADANIVIFERVKEEIRAGRGVATAIVTGYRKGLTAIVDANIVTFLVAFILFLLATAGVRGFAFTLGLGVIVSLFTAVLATQAILYSLRGTRLIRSRAALGAGEGSTRFRLDYMGASRWFFSASGMILLIGALAIAGKGINFGIDFEGGTRITAALERSATVDQVRSALGPDGADAQIQTLDNPKLGANVVQISSKQLGLDAAKQSLDRSFGIRGQTNDEEIGPTFGQTVANSAIIAIVASLTVISAYIALRFEWKFAVPVLIALMHDVLIVSGVYALVGREVTTSTVAALLTILGYSLYDTIIVCDRIRENIPRMPSAAFSQIVNRSLSEVIVRSLATSFCTLLPILALMLFGGETLRDFAFALLIGVASGTYSSIFIATPVLVHWKEREPVFKARIQRIATSLGAVPAYATTAQGGPVDVAPSTPRGGRRSGGAGQPGEEVSKAEFDEMVRELGLEEAESAVASSGRRGGRRGGGTEERADSTAAAPSGPRPAGGRRARARGEEPAATDAPEPAALTDLPEPGNGAAEAENGADDPDDDASGDSGRRPRNRRRHGRPR